MKEIRRILVPVDGSESSMKAAEQAVSISRLCESELDFVYVVSVNGLIGGYPLSDSELFPNAELDRIVGVGRTVLETAAERVPKDRIVRTHSVQGEPAEKILELERSLGADLIVMGSRGLSALKSAFLGSVSQYVVENAKCPVLVVKADKRQ